MANKYGLALDSGEFVPAEELNTTQPKALRLAGFLDKLDVRTVDRIQNCVSAAAELRRLHAYAAELESQVIADCMDGGAGGASPLMGAGDGWLQAGALLYRLTDERRPCNRDEINVTMADGSRSIESCTRRAGELLDCIRAMRAAQPTGGRTPQDYAIEHAEYMAKGAEHLLDTINFLNAQRDEDGETFDSDALARAEEAVTDAFGAVRNLIHEFRKRRDRAMRAAKPAPVQALSTAPLMGAAGDARWRDISTAPKDGRTVLVFPATWDDRSCSTAKYNPDKYAKKPKPYWYRDDAFGKVGICRGRPPTHWRELPPAPSSDKGVAHG